MSHPTVSVVIPVRDGARYLAAAVESVLGQTPPPTEVVVVDDGSRDATPEVLTRYGTPVQVVRQARLGMGAALNRGLEEATGELVGFCDADDLWVPSKQERQLGFLAQDPDCAGVGGLVQEFVSPDARDASRHLRVNPDPMAAAVLGALLLRRSDVDRIGTFEASMSFASAVDWIARARVLGLRLVTLNDVVLLRRVHTGNLTVVNPDEERLGLLQALRRQRRRHRDTPPTK